MFGKKSTLQIRRQTFETFKSISKNINILLKKTKNEKFLLYLNKLNDKAMYYISNDKSLDKYKVRKIFSLLKDVNVLLRHEIWNSNKIKKRISTVDDLFNQLLLG